MESAKSRVCGVVRERFGGGVKLGDWIAGRGHFVGHARSATARGPARKRSACATMIEHPARRGALRGEIFLRSLSGQPTFLSLCSVNYAAVGPRRAVRGEDEERKRRGRRTSESRLLGRCKNGGSAGCIGVCVRYRTGYSGSSPDVARGVAAQVVKGRRATATLTARPEWKPGWIPR
jgi:hypothetical protein